MDLNGRRILVTGALGQIGSELVPALRARVDPARVVASDIRMPRPDSPLSEGLFEISAGSHRGRHRRGPRGPRRVPRAGLKAWLARDESSE